MGEPSAWKNSPSVGKRNKIPLALGTKSKRGSHRGETHILADQGNGHASTLGTQSRRGRYRHGRNSQGGKPSAREKLTGCRIMQTGSRQYSEPRTNGRAICMVVTHSLSDEAIRLASEFGPSTNGGAIYMGETHKLSDQASRLASALSGKSKRGSHLHGRNSPAVGLGHRARVITRHQEQAG